MTILEKLISPDIIKAASASPLGILALMIVVLGVLAGLFFSRAAVQIRALIFVLIFGGAVAFGAAVVRTPAPGEERATPTPIPIAPTATKVLPTLEPTFVFERHARLLMPPDLLRDEQEYTSTTEVVARSLALQHRFGTG